MLGLCFCLGFSLILASAGGGPVLRGDVQASPYGFSCCQAWALGAWAPVVAATRTQAQ